MEGGAAPGSVSARRLNVDVDGAGVRLRRPSKTSVPDRKGSAAPTDAREECSHSCDERLELARHGIVRQREHEMA